MGCWIMSRGPESRFWAKLRKTIPHGLRAIRIEASWGEVDAGTPDVLIIRGVSGRFVELKVYPHKMNTNQLSWAEEHDRVGCAPVLVLVKRKQSIMLFEWTDYGGDDDDVSGDSALWTGTWKNINELWELLIDA